MKKIHLKRDKKQGFVTIQFLLAFMIIMFFTQSFLSLSLTLTHVTLVQYLTYSSSRRLSLGDRDPSFQKSEAEEKYKTLRKDLFNTKYKEGSNEWFEVPEKSELGFNPRYDSEDARYRNMFYGVFVPFTSRVFNFKIPLLTEGDASNLTAYIGSYLGREPSTRECENFFSQIKQKVCDLYSASCDGEPVVSNNAC